MHERLELFLNLALVRCVDFARERAIAVIVAIAAITAAASWYSATHLGVNADMDEMISAELPHRVLEMEHQKKFPLLSETAVIVIDAQTPEQASEAAEALAARMREHPDLFKAVYLPQGEFFEEHALLYMDTEQLEDFADRLARVQPYLAGLADDGTLRGLADILARGVKALREGDVEATELVPMFDRFTEAVRARMAGERYDVSWAEVVAGGELDRNARRRFIVTHPIFDFTEVLAAHEAVQALRRFIAELGLTDDRGVRVRMTGTVILSYEEMPLIQRQVALAGAASTVLVGILLAIALRSVRLVVANLAMLTVGLIWTAAFATLAIGHLNLISISFYVLFIGLGGDLGIHPSLRYQELMAEGRTHEQALRAMAGSVGSSLFLCACATAIGFYTFLPTAFSGIAELGLISGTSMFISFFLIFTLMPAIISIGRKANDTADVRRALPQRALPSFPARHPRAVAAVALAVGVAAMLLLPKVTFDRNPLHVRDPSAESVRTFEELLADSETSPWTLSVLAPSLPSAQQIASRLRELPEVERAITIADFVPDDQEEKLGILEDVAMFLAPPDAGAGMSEPTAAEQTAALAKLRGELQSLFGDEGEGDGEGDGEGEGRAARDPETGDDPELRRSARALDRALAAYETHLGGEKHPSRSIEALEASLVGSLPHQLESLHRALAAEPITHEKLPEGLVDRMVSAEGDVRIEVYPREDVRDNRAMEGFIAAVRTVAPNATGSAIGVYEASRAAVSALRQALVSAVVVIAVLLLVLWRTIGEMLLVMTPLALASVLTAALAVLLGIPFNFADIIVLPLLLGIGVDSGIHLVQRWRLTGARPAELLETSTAHGVIFSALTTLASFATLSFATHRGIASLGQLLTVGVATMVMCNLLILPALIELRMRSRSYKPPATRR